MFCRLAVYGTGQRVETELGKDVKEGTVRGDSEDGGFLGRGTSALVVYPVEATHEKNGPP